MTEEEKQRERECKRECVSDLQSIDVGKYRLSQIDERMEDYAQDLVHNPDGHNLYELLALRRFFSMLGEYSFRIDKARRFIRLYELLKFSGTHGRQHYRMTPVQVFQFSNVMGFYSDFTHRLFHDVLWYVPRKYGKTTGVASFAVNELLFGDTNAQAYTTANSYSQAKICFDEIRGVLRELDPGLPHFKLNREVIKWRDNPGRESFIRCLSSSADKLDGLNASLVINDEYSQADSANLYNTLTTSMGMRENPLVVTITTASDKPDSPFYSMLEGCQKILRGEMKDDHTFAHLFMPDVDDEEGDPRTWHKVQPHMGITVKEQWYADMWQKAQLSRDDMRAFRTKLLNVVETGSEKTWITGQQIRDHSLKVDLDHLSKKPDCEVAVDLSVRDDFSAVSYFLYFPWVKKAHIYTDYYLPEQTLNTHRNRELYRRWVANGYMHVCGKETIDYEQIARDIYRNGSRFRILKIGYDPNRAQTFQNTMYGLGGARYLVIFKQTNYYFTRAVEATEEMIFNDRITFDPNPINAYCYDNAVLDIDNMENMKPMKKSENLKIDGCITATMAIGLSIEQKRSPLVGQ